MNRNAWVIVAVVVTAWWAWPNPPDARYSELIEAVSLPTVGSPPYGLRDEPLQLMLDDVEVFRIDDIEFSLRAEFHVEARVLGREDYRRGRWARLAPMDLALGWGAMSDSEVLEDISIRQGGRFYSWRVDEFPIPRAEIESSSANMHIIPARPALIEQLTDVEAGQRLRLGGFLVDVDGDDGSYWRTSLRRTDTGDGACELFLVTSVMQL